VGGRLPSPFLRRRGASFGLGGRPASASFASLIAAPSPPGSAWVCASRS